MGAMDYSKVADLYDLYARTDMDVPFFLHTPGTFEPLARAQGFRVLALFGDYERTAFQAETSPFMIWTLGKQQDHKQEARWLLTN